MRRLVLLSMVLGLLPVSMMAQDDDMYFGSTKSSTPKRSKSSTEQTYYCGSKRSVDEYNRRCGSSYEVIIPDTGDIISFSPVEGVYPDSVGDYQLTRKMARWDDYTPTKAYWEGYAQGRHDSWGWHSPWYYSSFYPWYDYGWYDPWYYSYWRYGWYDPWYYDYAWGWGYPYYTYYGGYYGGYYSGGRYSGRYVGNGNTGTLARYGELGRSSTGGRVGNYTHSSRFDGARERAYSGNSGRRTTVGTNTSRSITRSSTRTTIAGGGSGYSSNSSSYGSGSSGRPATFQSGSGGGGSYSGGGNSYGGSRTSGGSYGGGGGTRSGGGGGGSRSGGGRR
jgi:hypothetical protein